MRAFNVPGFRATIQLTSPMQAIPMDSIPGFVPAERSFFERSPDLVARELIGALLIRRISGTTMLGGVIVETEAYLASDDAAAHNHRGKTKANAALFMRAGTIYVHRLRQHHCMDIVTEDSTNPSSVLLRAMEPVFGIAELQANRGMQDVRQLMRGPGRLCQALDITMAFDQRDILEDSEIKLFILRPDQPRPPVASDVRVGISRDAHLPLRFYKEDSPFVSRKRSHGNA